MSPFMLLPWVTCNSTARRRPSTFRNRARLRVEMLEDRCTPATFTVNTLDDTNDANVGDGVARDANGNTSLRAALMEGNASADASIAVLFQQGLTGTITLEGWLPDLAKNYTMLGPGMASLEVTRHLNVWPRFRIFTVPADKTCSIQGLAITRGSVADGRGGGIYNLGNLTLTACAFYGNFADEGGAICNAGNGVLTASGLWVYDNASTLRGGGICSLGGTVNLSASQVFLNWSEHGGGIHNGVGATFTMTDACQIYSNTANQVGGGIKNDGQLSMTGGIIESNSALMAGGIWTNIGPATLTGVAIRSNSASWKGGGFWLNNGTLTLDTCTVSNNTAPVGAGGLRRTGTTYNTINCTITDPVVEEP